MTLVRMFAIITAAAALAGCANQVTSVGVFEPTPVQPPPSERGSGLGRGEAAPAAPAGEGRGSRRGLNVPSR